LTQANFHPDLFPSSLSSATMVCERWILADVFFQLILSFCDDDSWYELVKWRYQLSLTSLLEGFLWVDVVSLGFPRKHLAEFILGDTKRLVACNMRSQISSTRCLSQHFLSDCLQQLPRTIEKRSFLNVKWNQKIICELRGLSSNAKQPRKRPKKIDEVFLVKNWKPKINLCAKAWIYSHPSETHIEYKTSASRELKILSDKARSSWTRVSKRQHKAREKKHSIAKDRIEKETTRRHDIGEHQSSSETRWFVRGAICVQDADYDSDVSDYDDGSVMLYRERRSYSETISYSDPRPYLDDDSISAYSDTDDS
jgi:hypothetical protein